jgi:hypothetical protein
MADDFDAAASWLSSNPSAASLPNDTKLEVIHCPLTIDEPKLTARYTVSSNMSIPVQDRKLYDDITS